MKHPLNCITSILRSASFISLFGILVISCGPMNFPDITGARKREEESEKNRCKVAVLLIMNNLEQSGGLDADTRNNLEIMFLNCSIVPE